MTRRGIPGGLRGILFDWDGTLLDSFQADSQAFLAMFREIGIAWGIEDLERHYSPDWYRMYRAARLPRARWEEADRIWGKHYRKSEPALLPGARRVLRALARRYELGLVTTGDRSRVCRQLKRFRLTEMFTARICGGDTRRRKPHPEPLLTALAGSQRVCRRRAGRCGDGAPRGSRGDRGAGSISDRAAVARGETGIPLVFDRTSSEIAAIVLKARRHAGRNQDAGFAEGAARGD